MWQRWITVRRRGRRRVLVIHAIHACTSQAEELWRRRGEEDVALGGDERQSGHHHRLDQITVDDQSDFDRIGRKSQNVGERAHLNLIKKKKIHFHFNQFE